MTPIDRDYRLTNRIWGKALAWLDDRVIGPIYQAGLDRAARKYQKQRAKHYGATVASKTLSAGERRLVTEIRARRSKQHG